MFTTIITALMAASASAFVPSATFSAVTRSSTALQMAYVPDGLTPAQYNKLKAEEAKKKKENKKKMKGSVETLTQWQARSAEKVSRDSPAVLRMRDRSRAPSPA